MDKDILKKIDEEFERVQKDESLKDVTFSKEGEEKLFAQIAQYKAEQEGKYANLSDEDRELIELGKEAKAKQQEQEEKQEEEINKLQTTKRRRRSKKMVFALAAAMVLTFAMGTVGITSRYKELRSEEKYAEAVEYRFLDSETDMQISDDVVKEQEAKQQIENFFGQPVLWLYGDEVKFEEVNTFQGVDKVEVVFRLNEYVVVLQVLENMNKIADVIIIQEVLVEIEEIEEFGKVFSVRRYYNNITGELDSVEINLEINGLFYNIKTSSGDDSTINKILEYLN